MDAFVGFVAAALAVLCFGSNFVPVKKFNAGDGMFFQWIMCTAIWMCGLFVNLARGGPKFEPYAMLGGFLWCTGNVFSVVIIRLIGLGMGMLVWGAANLMFGYLSGRFGFFGITPQTDLEYPAMNVIGACICFLSVVITFFIKSSVEREDRTNHAILPSESPYTPSTATPSSVSRSFAGDESVYYLPYTAGGEDMGTNMLLPRVTETPHGKKLFYAGDEEDEFHSNDWLAKLDKLKPSQKHLLGWTLAIVAGIFYGLNFDPPEYLRDHPEDGHSSEALDYVFSHFTGIFLTSTFYFLLYAALRKNEPNIYPKIVLPGFFSGVLWAVADICWFVANGLSFQVSFPIITTGPGIVANLWGVFWFREIKGRRNLALLFAAFITTIIGVGLITMSKVGF